MSVFSQNGSNLVYRYDAETLTIALWGEDALRVRATKNSAFSDEAWALLPQEFAKTEITIGEDGASITNGRITAKITSFGKLCFYNQKEELLLEEYLRSRKVMDKMAPSALEVEAREFKPILGGDYSLTARFEARTGERFYGMGQYQQPYLNLKGCKLELAHRNSQASVPFLLSSRGYGFLWNNPGIGSVTLGTNVTEWAMASTKELDYWIAAGDKPAEILEAYGRATGFAPMMPDWAMGLWQCKLRYRTQEELLSVAREYKRRSLPLSVIVIDFFHWELQGDWSFDPLYWPDPAAMVEELDGMGVKLMVSVWPTVDKRSSNYNEMLEKGYLIRTERGHRIAMDFLGDTVHYDSTNPEAREYIWQKCKKSYYDIGVRVFWLDEAEPEYTYYDFDLYRYYLGPNVQIGNLYPMMHAKAFYDGMTREGQQNIINLLRCAWAGSQRYGALVWSGDIATTFDSFRNQFAAGLNMGLAGIPWWTTDIGGFHGGNPDDPAFRELLIRWFQYGAFCPVMRLHGDRVPAQPPLSDRGGGLCWTGAPNEVWAFGEEAYGILSKFLFIREKLKPYIASVMAAAHEHGQPVIRPLFYNFPDDPNAWACEDAMMFGPDLLVAPVMESGQRKRSVYLPAGCTWTDLWTKKKYTGGTAMEVDAPLDRIPLFASEDSAFDFSLLLG